MPGASVYHLSKTRKSTHACASWDRGAQNRSPMWYKTSTWTLNRRQMDIISSKQFMWSWSWYQNDVKLLNATSNPQQKPNCLFLSPLPFLNRNNPDICISLIAQLLWTRADSCRLPACSNYYHLCATCSVSRHETTRTGWALGSRMWTRKEVSDWKRRTFS